MDDLVMWLLAQFDEDERRAPTAITVMRLRPSTAPFGDRLLAEIEAKRRILDLHPHQRFVEPLAADSKFEEDRRPAFNDAPRYVGCQRCDWDHQMEEARPSWWCDTVRLLTLPYADRAGYRAEWAPQA